MRSQYRFIAYTPFGDPIGQLTHPGSWKVGPTYNEIPGMTINYRDDMPNADRLHGVIEVGFEYSVDGTTWAEPPNGRFLRLARGRMLRGKDKLRRYTLPGIGHLLKKAKQSEVDILNADGKRVFNSATAGMILKTLIDENKTYGGSMTGVTYDFTLANDSAGQPWDKIISIAYEPGLDLYTIIDNLANQGMVDWYFQGRQLRVFNTAHLDVVRDVNLSIGPDIGGVPVDASLDNLIHQAMIFGDGGVKTTIDSGYTPPVYWGKWQGSVSNSGVSDEGTMLLLADQLLHDGSREKVQYTLELVTSKTRYEPFRDFVPGNRVVAPNEDGVEEPFRVHAVEVSREASGELKVAIPANDRFVEAEIGRSKRVIGITGGAVAGGSGTRPAPPEPANRIPAQVTGPITVTSVAVPNAAGFPRAIATLDWPDVVEDNAGVALAVDHYEVLLFEGEVPNPNSGRLVAEPPISLTSVTDLNPGSRLSFQVRAVTSSGQVGAWSPRTAVYTMDSDTTPPGVPAFTAADVTSTLGVVTIRWGGRAVGNAAMPPDFHWAEVYQQGQVAPVGTMSSAGYVTIGGLTQGSTYAFALRAVDKAGNASAMTAYHPVIVTSAATDAGIQAELDAIQADLQAGVEDMVGTAANGFSKVIYSTSTPTGDYPGGSTWYQRNANEEIIGHWEFVDALAHPDWYLDNYEYEPPPEGGDSFTDFVSDNFADTYFGGWVQKTISNAVLSNLDAGRITVGEMDGLRIKAGTIRADRLTVGLQENNIADPLFLSAEMRAARSGLGWRYDPAIRGMLNDTQPTARLSLAGAGAATSYFNLVQVVPGDKYYLNATVQSSINNQAAFVMDGYSVAGALVSSAATPNVSTPAATSTDLTAVWTVPAGVFLVHPHIVFRSTSVATNQVRLPAMTRQTSAVTIADGAITAAKIGAGTITANNIAVGALDGIIITAPTIRTAPVGDRTELTSQGIRLFRGATLKAWWSNALGQLRVYSTGDLYHASTNHALQVGDDDTFNLAIDDNEIMARHAGDFGQLLLNREGGAVLVGGIKGGFRPDGSNFGAIPKTDDHIIQLRGHVQVWDAGNGDYADEYAPFIVGPRGSAHLWMDHDSIGASPADGAANLFLNPPYADGSDHFQSVYIGSNSLRIRRMGPSQGAIICDDGDVALQLFNGQVNSRAADVAGNRSMGATSFNVISQTETKTDIVDIAEALDKVRKIRAKRWKFRDEVNPEDRWHYGPMLEDLPAEMHVPIGDDRMGYDLGSLVGLLWEAVGELAAEVGRLGKDPFKHG